MPAEIDVTDRVWTTLSRGGRVNGIETQSHNVNEGAKTFVPAVAREAVKDGGRHEDACPTMSFFRHDASRDQLIQSTL